MKVYVSGPITGTTDYMERFVRAETFLRSQGHEVVNPAQELAYMPKDTAWEVYMGESLKMLCTCDAIYCLKNSMRSNGAMIEYSVASQMGKQIMMEVVFNEENCA